MAIKLLVFWCWTLSFQISIGFGFSATNNDKQIPITILSGFLGSGKTTLLQNLLQNKEGLKIAVVVNDVASVNIDSKLVARGTTATPDTDVPRGQQAQAQQQQLQQGGLSDGMVELQNGCACCSLSDELMASVGQLVQLNDLRTDDEQFDHIVIELSGVADPKSVRSNFQEAAFSQMPLMDRVKLDTLVTLVDASMFQSYFASTAMASKDEAPTLFYVDGQKPPEPELEDWMKDLPPTLLEALVPGMSEGSESEKNNGVADLLVSQTETADLVVLNKCDLCTEEEVSQLQGICMALNPRAKIVTSTYGNLRLQNVLGIANGQGVAIAGDVDDHRDYVKAADNSSSSRNDDDNDDKNSLLVREEKKKKKHSVEGAHSHSHEHSTVDSQDHSDCTDPSHSHSHSHEDSSSVSDDSSHLHSHDHSSPSSHSHSHDHSAADCADPDCTDPSHSHSHSHDHSAGATHAGIGTFVYRARRPFHPGRLVTFLKALPIHRGIPESDDEYPLKVSSEAAKTLQLCLRSKGFCWGADSHVAAMYWSHAGSSFELKCLGQWWATLPRTAWPPDIQDYVLQDFDFPEHNEPDNVVGVGDRRQELVFIGTNYASAECQNHIRETLNQCLLNDKEYGEYQSIQMEEDKLQAKWYAALVESSNYVNY